MKLKELFENAVGSHPYLKVTLPMTELQALATDFQKGYGDRYEDVYSYVREQIIFMTGDLRLTTYFGADFKDSVKTADDLELWIIQYVVPRLKASHWPKPSTKEINDIFHSLKVEIMDKDEYSEKLKKN